jgi:hypothetical protein
MLSSRISSPNQTRQFPGYFDAAACASWVRRPTQQQEQTFDNRYLLWTEHKLVGEPKQLSAYSSEEFQRAE